MCSEGHILEYFYQKLWGEKIGHSFGTPEANLCIIQNFVYVMEHLQPPFDLFPTAASQLFAPINSFKEQRKYF